MRRSLRSADNLSVSLPLSLLDPIGGNVFVGLIYLCRNICMYMEPTLYPLLVPEPFTKCACTGTHACEIMYVVVRLCMCLTSRIDTNVGVRSGQPNFPSYSPTWPPAFLVIMYHFAVGDARCHEHVADLIYTNLAKPPRIQSHPLGGILLYLNRRNILREIISEKYLSGVRKVKAFLYLNLDYLDGIDNCSREEAKDFLNKENIFGARDHSWSWRNFVSYLRDKSCVRIFSNKRAFCVKWIYFF